MLEQIIFYNLTIFKINDFSLQINALLLIIIFLLALKFKKKRLAQVGYLLIIIGFSSFLNFTSNSNVIIELDVLSKLNFFIYNLLNYPINSLNTFFMIYSYLNIIVFIPFSFVFKKKKYFSGFIISFYILQFIFVYLNIATTNLNLYYLLLNILGYLCGYFIKKGGKLFG